MAKIFIDTNIILHLYDSAKHSKIPVLFTELSKRVENIILLRQSYFEFIRNRANVIDNYLKTITQINLNICPSPFATSSEVWSQITETQKKLKTELSELQKYIKNAKEDLNSDCVYKLFDALFSDANKGQIIENLPGLIQQAWQRKLVGNPPTSDKKTCGDEIIWEHILEYCKEDLVIVSGDHTFKDNEFFLKIEYHKKTGKSLIGIVDKITDALKLISIEPSKELVEAEEELLTSYFDKSCFDSDVGFVYIDENDQRFPYCFRCNRYTKHSGVMCNECGYKDYD